MAAGLDLIVAKDQRLVVLRAQGRSRRARHVSAYRAWSTVKLADEAAARLHTCRATVVRRRLCASMPASTPSCGAVVNARIAAVAGHSAASGARRAPARKCGRCGTASADVGGGLRAAARRRRSCDWQSRAHPLTARTSSMSRSSRTSEAGLDASGPEVSLPPCATTRSRVSARDRAERSRTEQPVCDANRAPGSAQRAAAPMERGNESAMLLEKTPRPSNSDPGQFGPSLAAPSVPLLRYCERRRISVPRVRGPSPWPRRRSASWSTPTISVPREHGPRLPRPGSEIGSRPRLSHEQPPAGLRASTPSVETRADASDLLAGERVHQRDGAFGLEFRQLIVCARLPRSRPIETFPRVRMWKSRPRADR